jgi:hypothetical protein
MDGATLRDYATEAILIGVERRAGNHDVAAGIRDGERAAIHTGADKV